MPVFKERVLIQAERAHTQSDTIFMTFATFYRKSYLYFQAFFQEINYPVFSVLGILPLIDSNEGSFTLFYPI